MARALAVLDDFTPLCMDADELADWHALNGRASGANRARRPCDDCLLGYAAEMRAAGRCNGEPGGDADPGATTEPEEDSDMAGRLSPEGALRIADAARRRGERQRAERQQAERERAERMGIEPPAFARPQARRPCDDCLHAHVCRLREDLVAELDHVEQPVHVADGVRIIPSPRAECDHRLAAS